MNEEEATAGNKNELEDAERRKLLQIVSEKGLKGLTIAQLVRLGNLLEAKDYGDSKRIQRSKKKLLKQINFAIYDATQKGRDADQNI